MPVSPSTRAAGALGFLAIACTAQTPIEYRSPYCGPGGGSPPWACGAWPSSTPPTLGRPGSATADPDTGNRVLRVTGPGSFGENPATAFKVLDAGWRRAWNADSTRLIVIPWSNRSARKNAYWVGFDPSRMALTRETGSLPQDLVGSEWDATDPDLIVGMYRDSVVSYNVRTGKTTNIFDFRKTGWRALTWAAGWSASRVCIADGPQDKGFRIACGKRGTSKASLINLREQTIDGKPFEISFRGQPASLPRSVGIHSIMLGLDGRWLAIDTHANSMCSVPGGNAYSSTGLFLDLDTNTGYEWNISCGATHWAYGYDGVMMQSTTPKWNPVGNRGPCNSDSRAVARRSTGPEIDSSFAITGPCSFFKPPTWAVNVHLSWSNNRAGARVNQYPVLIGTISNRGNTYLANEIAAMETTAPPYQGRLWRFAQTWNHPTRAQCGFLEYTSPSISPDGRWAVFPSDWQGQTGDGGVCANGNRTDVFVFELR